MYIVKTLDKTILSLGLTTIIHKKLIKIHNLIPHVYVNYYPTTLDLRKNSKSMLTTMSW